MSSFHSTTVVFSVWFFNHSDHHSYCRYCHIVKNKCWLCLISEYAKHFFFCLIGKTLCPAKAIIRGVFRTLSTMMELLVKIRYGFYLHYSFLTGSWIHPWSWYSIFFSNQTSLQNLVFLENCYKKEDMSYDFTFG